MKPGKGDFLEFLQGTKEGSGFLLKATYRNICPDINVDNIWHSRRDILEKWARRFSECCSREAYCEPLHVAMHEHHAELQGPIPIQSIQTREYVQACPRSPHIVKDAAIEVAFCPRGIET